MIPPQDQPDGGIVDFTYMSCMSMVAPHVAGVAALLLSAKPASRSSLGNGLDPTGGSIGSAVRKSNHDGAT